MVADLYLQLRSRTEAALSALLKLTADMQREPAMLDTLQNLLKDVREPLLFVVVGEVKAGKSSLLNALFGQEFCRVDVLPATDRIYIFKHGPREQNVDVAAHVTERYQRLYGEVAAERPRRVLHLAQANAELKSGVAVLLLGALRDHLAIVQPEHSHRHLLPGIREDAGHADLLCDHSRTHCIALPRA
jgi:hypothetical protein